ncbi:hypothetical protein M436DRAFT_77137 [Aureobasidium namibiae CBS 147.97]|uniref:Integral membrane protein n=1 Tax=Aureobasidium namibiae CBS 147.97 TaxID=1043004 RepID=A0A074W5E7_9PEZI|nr:uncharacterized protein M436DRAFT_77137 [Aureobasidium namibiae CBS 147.97]KEQ68078.1 hypothetical protein M436DRAFT_77137 [Aureobasidium namibiae CBS 147.97]
MCIVAWLMAFVYCKTHFYRDPGSAFFDEERAFTRQYSAYREEQSTTFFEEASANATKASESPSLCAVFMSIKRTEKQPLDLAVASALQGLTPQERADVNIGVLFAHTNPEDHPSWHNPRLHDLVDEAFTYNLAQEDHTLLHEWETSHNYAHKGVFDYIYSLQHCLNTTESPYIAIFEDDVIFADGWLSYTLNNLSNLRKKLASNPQNWLFLRLFNQERSTAWASREIGGNHEFVITIAMAIPLIALVLILRNCYPVLYRCMDNWTLAVVCLVILPAFIILFYQAGKASMLPPRPGVRAEPFGCCTQGLIFPRSTAEFILDILEERGSGQLDIVLNDIARDQGLTRYAQYPVMMQHLGKNSVRNTVNREAQAVWSMTFEQLSPYQLEQQHLEMNRLRYGA